MALRKSATRRDENSASAVHTRADSRPPQTGNVVTLAPPAHQTRTTASPQDSRAHPLTTINAWLSASDEE